MKCGIDVNKDRGEEGGAVVREVYVRTITSKRNHQKERRRKASTTGISLSLGPN